MQRKESLLLGAVMKMQEMTNAKRHSTVSRLTRRSHSDRQSVCLSDELSVDGL